MGSGSCYNADSVQTTALTYTADYGYCNGIEDALYAIRTCNGEYGEVRIREERND